MSSSTATRNVLLVDDNEDSAQTLAMVLRQYNHIVEICTHPAQALDTLRNFRPDVVLLDIGMPNVNGYELARDIRQMEGYRDVKLIAVTGYGLPEDKALAREAGFNHHVVKPVDIEQILGFIALPSK